MKQLYALSVIFAVVLTCCAHATWRDERVSLFGGMHSSYRPISGYKQETKDDYHKELLFKHNYKGWTEIHPGLAPQYYAVLCAELCLKPDRQRILTAEEMIYAEKLYEEYERRIKAWILGKSDDVHSPLACLRVACEHHHPFALHEIDYYYNHAIYLQGKLSPGSTTPNFKQMQIDLRHVESSSRWARSERLLEKQRKAQLQAATLVEPDMTVQARSSPPVTPPLVDDNQTRPRSRSFMSNLFRFFSSTALDHGALPAPVASKGRVLIPVADWVNHAPDHEAITPPSSAHEKKTQ